MTLLFAGVLPSLFFCGLLLFAPSSLSVGSKLLLGLFVTSLMCVGAAIKTYGGSRT